MSEPLKDALRSAVLRLLGPLVKLLLEAGIGAGEFATLVKRAYVRAAGEQDRSSKPNKSRIAVLTGLTRIEVASILEQEDAQAAEPDHRRQRAERVLTGWWNDPDFQSPTGGPASLPLKGARGSFAQLCRRYSGALEPARILEELVRVRAVRRLANGRIEALSRTYATVRWNPQGINAVGEHLSEHCATLAHNLQEPARPLYVQRILNTQLDSRYAAMLRREMEQQASSFADSIDESLNDPLHTAKAGDAAAQPMTLGIGLYVFEQATSDAPASEEQGRARTGARPGQGRRRRTRTRRGR
jgi:hypothetical protein